MVKKAGHNANAAGMAADGISSKIEPALAYRKQVPVYQLPNTLRLRQG